jgi:hypothetical protein
MHAVDRRNFKYEANFSSKGQVSNWNHMKPKYKQYQI